MKQRFTAEEVVNQHAQFVELVDSLLHVRQRDDRPPGRILVAVVAGQIAVVGDDDLRIHRTRIQHALSASQHKLLIDRHQALPGSGEPSRLVLHVDRANRTALRLSTSVSESRSSP